MQADQGLYLYTPQATISPEEEGVSSSSFGIQFQLEGEVQWISSPRIWRVTLLSDVARS